MKLLYSALQSIEELCEAPFRGSFLGKLLEGAPWHFPLSACVPAALVAINSNVSTSSNLKAPHSTTIPSQKRHCFGKPPLLSSF